MRVGHSGGLNYGAFMEAMEHRISREITMFKHLKLSLKLGIGFGLLVAIAGLLGAFAWKGLSNVGDFSMTMEQSARATQHLLNCRRHEKNFQLRGFARYGDDTQSSDEKWCDELGKLSSEVESLLARPLEEEERSFLRTGVDAMSRYQAAFESLKESRRLKEGVGAAWREAASAFAAAIQEVRSEVIDAAVASATSSRNADEMASWHLAVAALNEDVVRPFDELRFRAARLAEASGDEQWSAYEEQLKACRGSFARFERTASMDGRLQEASAKFQECLDRYDKAGAQFRSALLSDRELDASMVKLARQIEKTISAWSLVSG